MPSVKIKKDLLPKSYWKVFFPFLLFLTFFKFAGGLHYTLMAPFGEKVFPLWLVGIIIGLASIVQMIFDIPAGYILDKYGYKKLLTITTGIFFVASLVFLFGATPLSFIFTCLVAAFGWLFFGPGTNAYTLVQAPKKMVGRFVATRDVFASLGIVLSSALVVFAVRFETQVTGLILCGLFFISFIGIVLSPKERTVSVQHDSSEHQGLNLKFLRKAWNSIIVLKPVSFMLISTSLISAIFYAIIWFVVPLLLAHTEQGGVLGIGLAVFDFSVVALGFILGRIVDAYDKKILVICGLIIFAVAGTLLGFNFGALFILLGFIAATGEELTGLSLWAWLYAIDKEKKHYGLISSSISLFDDIGWAIGPVVAGILYTVVGPTFTIAAGGLLIFLNLFIFYMFVDPFASRPPHVSHLPQFPHHQRHKE